MRLEKQPDLRPSDYFQFNNVRMEINRINKMNRHAESIFKALFLWF